MRLGFTGMSLGLIWTDRLVEAERICDRAIAYARRGAASITDFASAMTMRANAHRRAGRLRDAEADARTALEAGIEREWSFMRGMAPLVCTLVDQGRRRRGRGRALGRGRRGIPDSPPMLPVLLGRVWVRGARREHAAAAADWEEALRRGLAARHERGVDRGLRRRGHRLRRRRRQRARDGDRRRGAEHRRRVGHAGRARTGAARQGAVGMSGDDAIDTLRGAVELLSQSPARFHEARARVSLGSALRRAGHRVDSREPLREG